jgi:hypothetical protein
MVTVNGIMSISDSTQAVFLRLVRNVATIAMSTGADTLDSTFFTRVSSSSDMMPFSISFLDEPETTSQLTYRLQMAAENAGRVLFLNRSIDSNDYRGVTTLTAMEVRS